MLPQHNSIADVSFINGVYYFRVTRMNDRYCNEFFIVIIKTC